MLNAGTCPYCGEQIANLTIEPIGKYEGVSHKYSGITLLCPGCQNVLKVASTYHQHAG